MRKTKWLFIACALQFALIGAMFISAYLPIYFGTKVKVLAKGYDPRDLIAGNFVRLDYGVRLQESMQTKIPPDRGVFVCLEKSSKEAFVFKEIHAQPPKNQLCIQTKISKSSSHLSLGNIEKYFAPKEKAQEIQNLLANPNYQAIVTLKILSGRARIIDLKVESIQ